MLEYKYSYYLPYSKRGHTWSIAETDTSICRRGYYTMNILTSAEQVLAEAGEPLHNRVITYRTLQRIQPFKPNT